MLPPVVASTRPTAPNAVGGRAEATEAPRKNQCINGMLNYTLTRVLLLQILWGSDRFTGSQLL